MPSAVDNKHVFVLDRMRGVYKDLGPATTADKVLAWFSAGKIRIAEVKKTANNSGAGVGAALDSKYVGSA